MYTPKNVIITNRETVITLSLKNPHGLKTSSDFFFHFRPSWRIRQSAKALPVQGVIEPAVEFMLCPSFIRSSHLLAEEVHEPGGLLKVSRDPVLSDAVYDPAAAPGTDVHLDHRDTVQVTSIFVLGILSTRRCAARGRAIWRQKDRNRETKRQRSSLISSN